MKLQQLVIGVLFVSLITTGLITYLSDIADNYGKTADFSGLDKTKAAMETQINQTEELQEILDTTLEEGNFFVIPYKLVKAAWTAVKALIITPLLTLRIIINELSTFAVEVLYIPSWVQGLIIALLTVSIISILIFAFFKWKFED